MNYKIEFSSCVKNKILLEIFCNILSFQNTQHVDKTSTKCLGAVNKGCYKGILGFGLGSTSGIFVVPSGSAPNSEAERKINIMIQKSCSFVTSHLLCHPTPRFKRLTPLNIYTYFFICTCFNIYKYHIRLIYMKGNRGTVFINFF